MEHLTAENVLMVLAIASAFLPGLELVAKMTANKTDDKIVADLSNFIHSVSSWIPRLRFGGPK